MSIDVYKYPDSSFNHSHSYLLPFVLKILQKNISLGDKIFEIGCGNGSVAKVLTTTGYNIIGIDPSQEGIEIANKAYPELKLHFGSTLEDLALKFGHFNLILSLEVVEHVYDPFEFAKRANDLLLPNGMLLLSTPFHGYLKNLALSIFDKWDDHFTALWQGGHIKFWSPKTITSLLNQTGFKVIEIHKVGRVPFLAKSMLVLAVKI